MKFPFEENIDKSVLFNQLQTEAHIWFFRDDVQLSDEQSVVYLSQLSVVERQRYQKFYYDDGKKSYLITHILLRIALSKYADVPVEAWQFICNEHGKPEIARVADLPEISFNITHTNGLCACVITRSAAVGIDAENINRRCKYKGLAKRMFSDDENEALDVSKNPYQQFYNFWTLREAYVKALGTGLSGSSKDFSFTMGGNDKCVSINHVNQSAEDDNHQFALYKPTDDHVLSVAIMKQKDSDFIVKQLVIREVFVLPDTGLCI